MFSRDWSSDVCSSDLVAIGVARHVAIGPKVRHVHRTHAPWDPYGAVRDHWESTSRATRASGLERLAETDPGFSVPVLQMFLVLVHRRAYEAIGRRDVAALAPFVSDRAREALLASNPHVVSVSEVVVGAVR